MKKLIPLPLLLLLGIVILSCKSCSNADLLRFFSKSIAIDFDKPRDYRDYSKYQKDAVYLINLLEQSYPRLDSKISDYDYVSADYLEKVSNVEDRFTFQVETQKFLAQLKDGHSYLPIDYTSEERFNISIMKEKENWILMNIEKRQDSTLIGSTIKSINGKSIKEVEERIHSIESGENEYWRLRRPYMIVFPKYCQGLGLMKEDEDLVLELEKEGIVRTVALQKSEPQAKFKLPRKKDLQWNTYMQNDGFFKYFDSENSLAYLQMNTCLDYNAIEAEIDNYAKKIVKPFALQHMKKRKKHALNFGIFLKDFFNQIDSDSVENLVIDLRYNTGGDARLGKQLIWYLTERKDIKGFTEHMSFTNYFEKSMPKDYKEYEETYRKKHGVALPEREMNISKEFHDEPYFHDIEKEGSPFLLDYSIPKFKGKVYVLIGRNTFSAANVLATTLYDNGIGTFVGRPTGNQPSCNTGFSSIKLPKTKELVTMSTTYYERPDRSLNDKLALHPHVEVQPSFEHSYMEGLDLSIEYVVDEISQRKAIK